MSTTLIRPDGQSLTFDATPTIGFQKSNTITDHPIEDGSLVSDHVQKQPDQVSLTGIVSDSPLGATGEYRVQDALRFLNEAGERGELLELESRFGLTGNWILESWPYDITQLRALAFEVSLRQVRIATTEMIMLPREVPRPVVADGAPPNVDMGAQPTKPVEAAEESKLKSVAEKLADWASGAMGGS